MGISNIKYYICCTDKWYLVRDTDDNCFDVILSDIKSDLLEDLCYSLNNKGDFTVQRAVEIFFKERRDSYVYDFLDTVLNIKP